jgi:hypothetical protein
MLDCGMVKRFASPRVVAFVLLAASGAVCQNVRQSLPDAPSAQTTTPENNFNGFAEQARSPLRFDAAGGNAGLMQRGLMQQEMMRPAAFGEPRKTISSEKEPNAIFQKYLYPSSLKRQSSYHSASNVGLMVRATSAISRPLISRDDSGKARLNISYLLRTLTAVAKDTASTPYWKRSVGEPFSTFGSTVGNDAGMNLWREFGPGIQQLMKSHAPKFISTIEDRITRR